MKFKYYLRGAGFGIITATIILTIAFLFQDTMTDAEIMRRATELGRVMQNKGDSPETLADMSSQGASQADLETGTDQEPPSESDPDAAPDDSRQDSKEKENTSDQNTAQTDVDRETGNDSQQKDQKGQKEEKDQESQEGQKDQKEDTSKTENPSSQNDSSKGSGSAKNDNGSQKDRDTQSKDGKVKITIEAGDVSRIVSGKVKAAGLVEDQADFNTFLGDNGYDNQLQPGTYELEKGMTFRQIADILTSR